MADEFDLKPTSRGEEFLDVILRSLGGDTTDIPQPVWRYEEYLAAIAKAIQNGGGGGSSGGGGALVVNVTETESDTHYIYTCDKTAGEILSALEEKAVIFKYESGYIESCVGGGQHLDGYQFVRGGTSAGDVQFVALAITDYPYYQD